MTDPFSITAGAVGITSVALQSITTLLEDIQAVKNAPEAIADLKEDLSAVETVLTTLNSELEESTLGTLSPSAKLDFAWRRPIAEGRAISFARSLRNGRNTQRIIQCTGGFVSAWDCL